MFVSEVSPRCLCFVVTSTFRLESQMSWLWSADPLKKIFSVLRDRKEELGIFHRSISQGAPEDD
jgi:hypothetical protein